MLSRPFIGTSGQTSVPGEHLKLIRDEAQVPEVFVLSPQVTDIGDDEIMTTSSEGVSHTGCESVCPCVCVFSLDSEKTKKATKGCHKEY